MENEQTGKAFPTGRKELVFGFATLCAGLLLINSILFGGFSLGFAIGYILCLLCSALYLVCSGHRPSNYSFLLLFLSLVIAASFARLDDSPVKFVMFCFLLVSTNLGLCLMAGKNRHTPGAVRSLEDAAATLFSLGVGELPASYRGLHNAFRGSGTIGQKSGAILLGLGITVPLLLIIVPLLMQADAAFEGMLRYFPSFSFPEFFGTVVFGGCLGFVLYTRNTALQYKETIPSVQRPRKGVSPLTVNTVLIAICLVYCAYLASQLAYFTGGLSGILPEDYTLAEYARRGFFEMAWLCAINLAIILFALTVCAKENGTPLSTRLFCLFIGIVTLFFIIAASAKMILYIDSFGLTRLRVLTQVVMVFFAVVTVLVSVWLFVPKLPYMKAVMISALLIGAAVSWADVDTQVARYNVSQYLSGQAKTVDVDYLTSLGSGAVPYLAKLAQEAPDTAVLDSARFYIDNHWCGNPHDFRDWNYVNHIASEILGDSPSAVTDTTHP